MNEQAFAELADARDAALGAITGIEQVKPGLAIGGTVNLQHVNLALYHFAEAARLLDAAVREGARQGINAVRGGTDGETSKTTSEEDHEGN